MKGLRKLYLLLIFVLVIGAAYGSLCVSSGGARACGSTCQSSGGNCDCTGTCSDQEYKLVLQ